MKNLLLVAVIGLLTLASCGKCYECTGSIAGTLDGIEYCEKDYPNNSIDVVEAACTAAGGTWSSK